MTWIIPHRFAEVAALLPLLHVRTGPTTVAAVGPAATIMAAEALHWRDTIRVFVLSPVKVNDRRIEVVTKLEPACCDVVLLSPDQDPTSWVVAVRPGGLIQAMTMTGEKLPALKREMRRLAGNAVPWREHLPQPVYGVLSTIGSTHTPKRLRQPPPAAKRLTDKYLPCLFTFGRDELALAFSPSPTTVAPPIV